MKKSKTINYFTFTVIDTLYLIGYYLVVFIIRETEHFKSWIRGLRDKITRAIITARIRRLSAGNFGDVRSVGEGVSELRIDYGPGFRVYFVRREDEFIVILCGGDKSTQSNDIAVAKNIAANLEVVI